MNKDNLEYTWNLEAIYKNNNEFENEYKNIEKLLEELKKKEKLF